MRRIGIILMRVFLSLIIVAAVWGCAGNTPRGKQTQKNEALQAELDTPITLAFSQIASLEGGKIIIEFADVTEDSRCPVNVTCVWEGQATVALNISLDGKDMGSLNLTSRAGHEKLAIADIESYSIRLQKVEPTKTPDEIELDEYIITLIVSKIQ
jgi:hypothetical protein